MGSSMLYIILHTFCTFFLLTTSSYAMENLSVPKSTRRVSHEVQSTQTNKSKSSHILLTASLTSLRRPDQSSFSQDSLSSRKTPPRSPKKTLKKTYDKNNITTAVRNGNIEMIKTIINNPHANLNQKDEWGNTALHRAILLKNKIDNDIIQTIVHLLILDPRTDSSIKNDTNSMAHQFLDNNSAPALRIPLFGRVTLDIHVNKAINQALFDITIIDKALINNLIGNIRNEIDAIKTAQIQVHKDRILPNEASLPTYATDDFIFTMIQSRIPAERIILEKLVQEEASIILFNVHIDKDIIMQSVKNIQNNKTLSHDKPHYITDIFIFKMIEQYINNEKTKIKPIVLETIPQQTPSLISNKTD